MGLVGKRVGVTHVSLTGILRVPKATLGSLLHPLQVDSWTGAFCSGTSKHCSFSAMLCHHQALLQRPASEGKASPKGA